MQFLCHGMRSRISAPALCLEMVEKGCWWLGRRLDHRSRFGWPYPSRAESSAFLPPVMVRQELTITRRPITSSGCAEELATADWLIAQIERDKGLTVGAIDLLPILETGKGVAAVNAIASAGIRTRRL